MLLIIAWSSFSKYEFSKNSEKQSSHAGVDRGSSFLSPFVRLAAYCEFSISGIVAVTQVLPSITAFQVCLLLPVNFIVITIHQNGPSIKQQEILLSLNQNSEILLTYFWHHHTFPAWHVFSHSRMRSLCHSSHILPHFCHSSPLTGLGWQFSLGFTPPDRLLHMSLSKQPFSLTHITSDFWRGSMLLFLAYAHLSKLLQFWNTQ